MKNKGILFLILLACSSFGFAQNKNANPQPNQEILDFLKANPKLKGSYSDLKDALKNPLEVIHLYLGQLKLEKIPIEVLKFKNMEELDLSYNNIKEIPFLDSKIS